MVVSGCVLIESNLVSNVVAVTLWGNMASTVYIVAFTARLECLTSQSCQKFSSSLVGF